MGYKPAYIWNGTSFDQIGNQAVASLDDYALLSPVSGQIINNTTLTNTTLTTPTINGGTSTAVFLVSPSEKATISATAATGTVNFDVATQSVLYYTTNASANFTLNIRGNSSTTLSSMMDVGESYSVNFLCTNGSTPYYATAYQIDGVSVTPKWQYGAAPTGGNANSIDVYNLTIVKTAATPTYVVLAAMAKFA